MFKALSILMLVAIAAITGFQVFWLRETYFKEKKNLEFRSNVVFKETVRGLQSKKLNLDRVFTDSTGKIRIEVMDGEGPVGFPGHPEELANVLNDVTVRVTDSLQRVSMEKRPNLIIKKGSPVKDSLIGLPQRRGNMIISMNETFTRPVDSIQRATFERRGPKGEIFKFLYSVDSLQDSLRVKEIDSACRVAFA